MEEAIEGVGNKQQNDQTNNNLFSISCALEFSLPINRVAKCHAYDGYVCVKILAEWGKSLGNMQIWQNQAFLGKICTTL